MNSSNLPSSYVVRVFGNDQQFECAPDKPVLTAALAANSLMSYGCRQGMCGSCRGRVVEGSISYPAGFPDAITEQDANAGFALFCSAYPTSDLVIDISRKIESATE